VVDQAVMDERGGAALRKQRLFSYLKKKKNKKIGCFLIKTKNWLFLSNISYESIKKKGDVRETTLF
jgi:hypothetical protein